MIQCPKRKKIGKKDEKVVDPVSVKTVRLRDGDNATTESKISNFSKEK